MSLSLRLPMHCLRAAFLAVLLLGTVVKPMLGSVCDIHALHHALGNYGRGADMAEHVLDRDHAGGRHAQAHEYDNGGTYAHLAVDVLSVPALAFEPLRMPRAAQPAVPSKPAIGPFRPPSA